ncbi:hypothetical protein [Streptomyces sp. NPDC055749]
MSDFQERAEVAVTRWLLVGIFALGLVAQFVKPVGDALQDKAFLGGALLSLVGYVLYSSVQRLIVLTKPPVEKRVSARDLSRDFEDAFAEPTVSIDFIGFTGETVVAQIFPVLERLKSHPGAVRRVVVRMILPDFWESTSLPGRITREGVVEDDPEFRAFLQRKIGDYRNDLMRVKGGLRDRGVVHLEVDFRVFRMTPGLKLYLVNGDLAFEGYYNRLDKSDFPATSADRKILDPQGYDSMLTRWHPSGGKDAIHAIKAWREYFDELWVLSREPEW